MPDLVRFRNFAEAKQFVLTTPPIRGRGSNIIPWSRDRRNPDTFNVRLTKDFDGKELVACKMSVRLLSSRITPRRPTCG